MRKLLYYAGVIDSTMLIELNFLVAAQTKPTTKTAETDYEFLKLLRVTSRYCNVVQE